MLAPLALVALLIGGTQTAIVVSDEEVTTPDHTSAAEMQTVETVRVAAN
ncbi:hypothetical protein [Halochromatium salexigens]|nr:hypothetical protein [Halochromatium salexigens]